MSEGLPCDQEGTARIRRENSVPLLDGQLIEGNRLENRCIVYQQVNVPVEVYSRHHCVSNRLFRPHITLYGDRQSAQVLDGFDRLLSILPGGTVRDGDFS